MCEVRLISSCRERNVPQSPGPSTSSHMTVTCASLSTGKSEAFSWRSFLGQSVLLCCDMRSHKRQLQSPEPGLLLCCSSVEACLLDTDLESCGVMCSTVRSSSTTQASMSSPAPGANRLLRGCVACREALDAALLRGRPEIVVALCDELLQRGGLSAAVGEPAMLPGAFLIDVCLLTVPRTCVLASYDCNGSVHHAVCWDPVWYPCV